MIPSCNIKQLDLFFSVFRRLNIWNGNWILFSFFMPTTSKVLVRCFGKKDTYARLPYPRSSQLKQPMKDVESKNRHLYGSQINCTTSLSCRICVYYFPEVLPSELPDLHNQVNSVGSWQWFEEKKSIMCKKKRKEKPKAHDRHFQYYIFN